MEGKLINIFFILENQITVSNYNNKPCFYANMKKLKIQPVAIYRNQITTRIWEHHSLHMLHGQIFLSSFAHSLPCCKLCNHTSCVLCLLWHQQVEAQQDAECTLQCKHAAAVAGLIRTQGLVDSGSRWQGNAKENILPKHKLEKVENSSSDREKCNKWKTNFKKTSFEKFHSIFIYN